MIWEGRFCTRWANLCYSYLKATIGSTRDAPNPNAIPVIASDSLRDCTSLKTSRGMQTQTQYYLLKITDRVWDLDPA